MKFGVGKLTSETISQTDEYILSTDNPISTRQYTYQHNDSANASKEVNQLLTKLFDLLNIKDKNRIALSRP